MFTSPTGARESRSRSRSTRSRSLGEALVRFLHSSSGVKVVASRCALSRVQEEAMAGEMLASAIVKQVAGKLCSAMCMEVGLVLGLEKSLKEMESTLSTLEAVLEDAERRSIKDRPLREWLKKLKDAAYDIDDLLNEFQAKLDKGGVLFRYKLKWGMAHRMKTLRGRLDKIAADRIKFHLQESSSVSERRLAEIEKRETFSEIEESMVYGSRHEDREKIVRFLLKSGEGEEFVGVIPIVGLGGMGKTTVAKLAFNDERVKHASFDLRIWVYVSIDFDLRRVARAIISSGTGASCGLQDLESMKNCIKDLVKGKRFLFVLDDVWTENADEWENLKLLLRGGTRGSKIIVTTRSESVALLTGTVPSHRLKGLTEEDCWALIKRRAFRSGDEERRSPNLVAIGRQIAKKCAGVPLAANAVGTMLRSNLGEETWSAIRDSRNWEVENDQDRVLSSLKLSYYEMPAGLKQCFAYCSIFPKGYVIDKNKLIYQWISLGFIHQSKDASFSLMEEIGNEYINILLWMSFLQDLQEYTHLEKATCKMHDLVHDLARSVAAGEVSVVETQKEARDVKQCRYASLAGCHGPSEVPKRLLKKVRALHFMGDGSMKLPDSTFSHATSLRALDFNGCWLYELPTSISKLKQLRYLDAPNLMCEKEPNFLQFLHSLQVLNLSQSSFSSLPKSIGNILKLHLINLSGCFKLQGLPTSIGNLKNLHYLNLSYCKNLLDLPASIGNLQNLHHLNLLYCMNLHALPESIGNLKNLHHLNLSYCSNLIILPPSIAGLGNLQTMILFNCMNLINIPPPIHLNYFPKLEMLDLQCCDSIASFPKEIFDNTNLKHLKVLGNNSLLSTFIECCGKHINTEELEHQNLMGRELDIVISIERMDHPRDARRVNLSKKQNVRSLILRSGSYSQYLAGEYKTRVLSYLSPHPNLKVLKLEGYMGRSFPSWMIDSKELRFQNLVELTLDGVIKGFHFPSLGHLPSLEVLRLKQMLRVKHFRSDAQYPSLKELEFVDMRKLKKWTTATMVDNGEQSFEVFLYPRLEKLTFKGCPSLKPQPCLPASVVEMAVKSSREAIMSCEWRMGPSSSLMSSSASSSSSTTLLKTLYIRRVHSADGWKGLSHHTTLEELTIESCNLESLPDSIQGLTCLRSLIVSDCSSLHSLPSWLGNLTSLQSLKISECPRMIVSRDIMEGLTSLITLKITGCPNLANLPEMLGDISSLQVEIS